MCESARVWQGRSATGAVLHVAILKSVWTIEFCADSTTVYFDATVSNVL